MTEETRRWIEADRNHCWHPFTDQAAWTAADEEPLVIVRGEGARLWDSEGRCYLDGNASIWTNIHGHRHPVLDRALKAQVDSIAHSSFLGLANPRAAELAERLCGFFPEQTLERVFFSDDGSTAVEVALKMALQFRVQTGEGERTRFVAFDNAYHGDTLGAASLGGVSRFFERFRRFGLEVDFISSVEELGRLDAGSIAGVILEPLIQGVNEMHLWPQGMLKEVRRWCDQHGAHLILDEVLTGFGRTGTMFACQQEGVVPDFLCLAKGLTGGYLPLAATLTTDEVYQSFNGPENAFYYGHSYTANQLGCAVALASLDVFRDEDTLRRVSDLIPVFQESLDGLAGAGVREVRTIGLMAGVDFEPGAVAGARGREICRAARELGLLTRPILDTLVLIPPLVVTAAEIREMAEIVRQSLGRVSG